METSRHRVAYRYLVALSTFSLEEFRNLPFESMEQYLKSRVRFLGKGHSRMVFDLGNGSVLKLGIGHHRSANLKEAKTSACLHGSDVLDSDPEGKWLIMEKVKIINSIRYLGLLNSMLGLPSDIEVENVDEAVELWDVDHDPSKAKPTGWFGKLLGRDSTQKRLEWLNAHPTPWWKNIKKAIATCGLMEDDLLWHNFGELNGSLVILDYGD